MLIFFTVAHADGLSGMSGNGFLGLMPIFLIAAVMYFLIIRPQNKKEKARKEMISQLKKGDKVITSGGVIATISKVIDEHEVMVNFSKDTEVKMVRSYVSQVLTDKKEKDKPKTMTKTKAIKKKSIIKK